MTQIDEQIAQVTTGADFTYEEYAGGLDLDGVILQVINTPITIENNLYKWTTKAFHIDRVRGVFRDFRGSTVYAAPNRENKNELVQIAWKTGSKKIPVSHHRAFTGLVIPPNLLPAGEVAKVIQIHRNQEENGARAIDILNDADAALQGFERTCKARRYKPGWAHYRWEEYERDLLKRLWRNQTILLTPFWTLKSSLAVWQAWKAKQPKAKIDDYAPIKKGIATEHATGWAYPDGVVVTSRAECEPGDMFTSADRWTVYEVVKTGGFVFDAMRKVVDRD